MTEKQPKRGRKVKAVSNIRAWGVRMESGTMSIKKFQPYLIARVFDTETQALLWCCNRAPDGMMARAVKVEARITPIPTWRKPR